MQQFTKKYVRQNNQLSIFTLIAWFLIICSVVYGIHLRVIIVSQSVVDRPIRADAYDYYHYAKNIKEQSIYSRQPDSNIPLQADALRSPGFPFFASFFFQDKLIETIKATKAAQALVQILCFLLISFVFYQLLGLYWSLPAIAALWSFPHFANINIYYLSESLFCSVLALTVFIAWKGSNANRINTGGVVIGGLCIGVAALIRPVLELFPLFVLCLTLLFSKKNWKSATLFVLFSCIPIIGWKIRNLLAIGELSDPTLAINGFYHGSFPHFMYNNRAETFGFPYRFDPLSAEVYNGFSATLNLIWEKIIASPAEYARWYLYQKQTYLWQWGIIAGQGDIYIYPIIKTPYGYLPDMKVSHYIHHYVHNFWVYIGLATTLITVALVILRKIKIHPVWLCLIIFLFYAILIHIPVAGFPRYSIPYKIILIPVAVWGIKQLTQWSLNIWKSSQK